MGKNEEVVERVESGEWVCVMNGLERKCEKNQ